MEWRLPGLGERGGDAVFKGCGAADREGEKRLKRTSNDGCSTTRKYLMPVNCTLKNGYNGQFCHVYFITIS